MISLGVCVWTKGEGGSARGIQAEVSRGNFVGYGRHFRREAFGAMAGGYRDRDGDGIGEAEETGGGPKPLRKTNVGSLCTRATEVWERLIEDVPSGPGEGNGDGKDRGGALDTLADESLREWCRVFMLLE